MRTNTPPQCKPDLTVRARAARSPRAPETRTLRAHSRVQLVRRDGRDVSTLYGREGGAARAEPARQGWLANLWERRRRRRTGTSCRSSCAPSRTARPSSSRLAPPPRTKWTRRVPHPVLIGHVASLTAPRPPDRLPRGTAPRPPDAATPTRAAREPPHPAPLPAGAHAEKGIAWRRGGRAQRSAVWAGDPACRA